MIQNINRLIASVFALAIIAGTAAGCKQSGKHSEQYIADRVMQIYADAKKVYPPHTEEGSQEHADINLDELYCSDDWNRWLEKVNDWDNRHIPEGEMGFFDADYWVMGQDWDQMNVKDLKITDITGERAKASFRLEQNEGFDSNVKLILVFERGDWYIDDFISADDESVTWKKSMQLYLENGGWDDDDVS